MFLLIPLIIIFLLLSYIYLNDVTLFTEITIYIVVAVIIILSFFLYRKIKQDLQQQEINALEAEVIGLEKKLKTTEDETLKDTYQRKIKAIKKEIEAK